MWCDWISSWWFPRGVAIRSRSVPTTFLIPHPIRLDLVGPHRHALERSLAVGRHHRDVDGVTPQPDWNASDAGGVEARVERPPALPQPHLEPRVEVHRRVRPGDADVGHVAEDIARRDAKRAAEGDAEVGE